MGKNASSVDSIGNPMYAAAGGMEEEGGGGDNAVVLAHQYEGATYATANGEQPTAGRSNPGYMQQDPLPAPVLARRGSFGNATYDNAANLGATTPAKVVGGQSNPLYSTSAVPQDEGNGHLHARRGSMGNAMYDTALGAGAGGAEYNEGSGGDAMYDSALSASNGSRSGAVTNAVYGSVAPIAPEAYGVDPAAIAGVAGRSNPMYVSIVLLHPHATLAEGFTISRVLE
jgi:hypothetical protein